MKKDTIMLLLCFCALGCTNANKQSRMMTEDEYEEYKEQKYEEGMIAIGTYFEPTQGRNKGTGTNIFKK